MGISETEKLDPFTAEIMRSYLISTVREMVLTTTRTAFSTCFCHGEDFTCALFDRDGAMIAQDQGVTVHAGAMWEAVRYVIETQPNISEGDVFLHNDPYNWGTHQGDCMVCRPIFYQGERVGFAANRGHWTDIGGMAPGGWSGTAEDVVQEGLILSSIRLIDAGKVNDDIRRFLLRNVRMADQLWGDIQSQIASNIVAERRIRHLIDRYGLKRFRASVRHSLDYSRRRFQAGLERIPDGEAQGEDVIEDDGRGGGPFPIRVTVKKMKRKVTADFSATHAQVMAPINCSIACTKAAVVGSLLATIDPNIPLNSGLMDCIELVTAPGTIVHPTHPAPTFASTADPVDRACEAMLLALGQLVPERVPAGSYSTGNNVTGGGFDDHGKEFLWYIYMAGGCGAYRDRDGSNAEWHLMSNCKNESMETWEVRYPVEFLFYSLLPDSGGAGAMRGGLGTERRLRVTANTRLTGISDHHGIGAHGLADGKPGTPNGFAVLRDGREYSISELFGVPSASKFSNVPLRKGDVFVTRQGGGGGYGDPRSRARELLERDLQEGYVSQEAAARQYG
jgi:N-methylhydantoinase B/oxoprolinase/acetone carboxylase alpha subunit